ncbi:MAG: 50S ribosomal protein L2 [Candidatus Paceibacterota bacterium]
MKSYRPTTKSRRHMTTISYRGVITASEPHKSLTGGFKRSVGRNNQGRVTVRHKGSGHKRLYREIDFKYNKINIPAKVETVEYDPNRSGFISLVCYRDGERRYVLLPKSVKVGDVFTVSEKADLKPGNRLPIKNIPVGTFIYNIELKPGAGAKLVRSAGNYAEVVAHDEGYAQIKLPSTEIRKVLETAWASVGEVSNEENWLVNLGKAGRSRWLGIRPTVRGTAMNPVDHPHGGGEGRQGRGRRRAISMWGKPTGKGQKSRKPKKYSNHLIVSRRKVGKKK